MRAATRRHLASIAEWARPSLLPATIAGCVILAAGVLYERQNESLYRTELQGHVSGDLTLAAARLQNEVNGNVAALRSVANLFAEAIRRTHDGKSVSKLFRGVDPQYAPPPVPGEGA